MAKNKIVTLAISLLAGLIITGGVAGVLSLISPSTAYAAPQSTDQPDENKIENETADVDKAEAQETDKQDSAENDNANEAADNAALAAKATRSAAQAEEAAKAAYPGCKINSTKLGDEDGVVVYEVSVTDKSGKTLEVKVDAASAKVLSGDSNANDKQEADDEETDGDNLQQEGEN